jgi:hypothetical protein
LHEQLRRSKSKKRKLQNANNQLTQEFEEYKKRQEEQLLRSESERNGEIDHQSRP